MNSKREWFLSAAAAVLVALLMVTGIHPYDRVTWALEVFPVVVALPVLALTYRRFTLTDVLYILVFLHALVLITGGFYTYARVPIGFEFADLIHSSRNPFDKLGHFFQGLVPALIAREILIRGEYVTGRRMLTFVVVCIVLAISASYELLEWLSAVLLGQGASDFLGTQGDVWDTQSDMFFALLGGTFALFFLSGYHDYQLMRVHPRKARM